MNRKLIDEIYNITFTGRNSRVYFIKIINPETREYIVEIPCSSTLNNPNNNFSLVVPLTEEDRKPTLERLVPNPAMDFIFVEINSFQEQEVELMIFDARGLLVKTQSTNLLNGINATMIDIAELPAGFYSIYVPQAKTKFATKRFVKVRE